MASLGGFDRRTDIEDFVNSIRESTHDQDLLAYEHLPSDLDSTLITESIGIDPNEIVKRAAK